MSILCGEHIVQIRSEICSRNIRFSFPQICGDLNTSWTRGRLIGLMSDNNKVNDVVISSKCRFSCLVTSPGFLRYFREVFVRRGRRTESREWFTCCRGNFKSVIVAGVFLSVRKQIVRERLSAIFRKPRLLSRTIMQPCHKVVRWSTLRVYRTRAL